MHGDAGELSPRDVALSVRRRRRLVLVAAGLAVLVPALVLRDWIGAQARAVTVLSTTLETPVLAGLARRLTDEPRLAETTVAGARATIARPAGVGPWPALIFVNGATLEGRRHPTVRRLARGLARAGFVVVVPDVRGLATGSLDGETVDSTIAVARAVAGASDTRAGRVGLVGVSTGATLALVAAREPGLAAKVSIVSGVAPYSDVREVVRIATTGTYRRGGRLERERADPFLLEVVARSLALAIPAGQERDALVAALERGDAGVEAGTVAAPLGPRAEPVARVLFNRDPERFDALYGELDAVVRARLERLSPLAGADRVEIAAPVELASGPQDKFFPISESRAVARIAPRLRVTVTGALDHAELEPSLSALPDLARLNGFVVRSLRLAAR